MRKLPLSAKKAISVIVTIGMIISLFSCMSGLSAFAIDNTAAAKSAVSPVEVKSEVKEEVVEKAAPVNEVTYADESKVIQIQPYGGDTHLNHCICGNQVSHAQIGEHTYEQVDSWKGTTTLPKTAGNYYLTENLVISASTSLTASSSGTINICLNGKTLTYSGNVRAFSVAAGCGATINICDCRGEATVTANSTVKQNGALFLLNGASTKSANINFFGGTFDYSERGTGTGGLFFSYTGLSTDNISFYGGTFKGSVTNPASGGFGNFTQGLGSFNVYGGTFEASKSSSSGGYINAKNVTSINIAGGIFRNGEAKAHGGFIYAAADSGVTSTITISGGTFDGGKAATNGGIIYTSNVALNIKGGTIQNGVATAGNGGNIYASGTLEINGGTISGGTSSSNGGCIYSEGAITISGGTIQNSVSTGANGGAIYATKASGATNTPTITISGGEIKDCKARQGGGLIFAASTVTTTISGGILSGGTAESFEAATGDGTDNANGGGIIKAAGKLTISGNALIKDGVAEKAIGGNIYASGTLEINGGTIKDGQANASGGNIYASNQFTMTGGEISGGKAVSKGAAIRFEAKKDCTISGGTIYAGELSNKDSSGRAISYSYYTTDGITPKLTIGGDALITVKKGDTGTAANGGLICIDKSEVEITDNAVVSNGNATNGGNIAVIPSTSGVKAKLTVSGNAEISGGTAIKGGNIYLSSADAVAEINGGTIENGIAGNPDAYSTSDGGGNIYLATSSTVTMNAGTVQNGIGYAAGGNVYINGSSDSSKATFTHNGGVITGGKALGTNTDFSGGNIFVRGDYVMNKVDPEVPTEVSNGITTSNYGGNISLNYGYASVVINDGTIKNGAAKVEGAGNIAWWYQGVGENLKINGGTITNDVDYELPEEDIYSNLKVGGVFLASNDKTRTLVINGNPTIDDNVDIKNNKINVSEFGGIIKMLTVTGVGRNQVVNIGEWDKDYIAEGNIALENNYGHNVILDTDEKKYLKLTGVANKETADRINEYGDDFMLHDKSAVDTDIDAYKGYSDKVKEVLAVSDDVIEDIGTRQEFFNEMTKVKVKTCSGFGEDSGSVLYGFYSLLDYAGIDSDSEDEDITKKEYDYATITITINDITPDPKKCDKGYKYVTYDGNTFLSVDDFGSDYVTADAFLYYATVSLKDKNAQKKDVKCTVSATIYFNDGTSYTGESLTKTLAELYPAE